MVKRDSNVFGSSSDSETDVETSRILNNKRKKKPPVLDTREIKSCEKTQDESSDAEYDYMKFPTTNRNNEDLDEPRKFEKLKYDETQRMKREEALKKSLLTGQHAKNSMGLSIMERMGFKVGDSLGKSEKNTNLIATPIEVSVKRNRLGIGATTETSTEKISESKIELQEYRDRIQQTKIDAKNMNLINKAMLICFELSGDSEKYYNDEETIKPRSINYLWRPYVFEIIEKSEKNSLRKRVIRIEGEKNLVDKQSSPPDSEETDVEFEDYLKQTPIDRLERIHRYLRDNHNYCLFCGHAFESQDDLRNFCPGILEDDHFDK